MGGASAQAETHGRQMRAEPQELSGICPVSGTFRQGDCTPSAKSTGLGVS